jgi:hypothetical protein
MVSDVILSGCEEIPPLPVVILSVAKDLGGVWRAD